MAFGQDFLRGFFSVDGLRDYTHASKTFRTNGYELAPRFKYLFHVSFTLNQAIPKLNSVIPLDDQKAYSLLVKTVTMPNYEIEVAELNQYNRKRYAQTKIKYLPVDIVFHDDGGDLIRNLWYNYFTYYYKDPSQPYGNLSNTNGTIGVSSTATSGAVYNNRDIYDQQRNGNDWGYVGESYSDGFSQINTSGKPAFFRDITITTFDQHKTAQYVLINPIITSWKGDTHDYSQSNGTMSHTMSIKYETVKYISGAVGKVRPDTNVFGFADPAHYDVAPSPLTGVGGVASIVGQGGLLDTGIGIVQDLENLNVVGAAQKAGTAYNTFRNVNIREIARDESIQASKQVIKNSKNIKPITNSVNGIFFPTPKR